MATPRDSTTARGYGTKHQRVRARFARQLRAAGQLPCARCLLPIYASWPLNPPDVHVPACRVRGCEGQCWTLWDAGHTDERDAYSGLEHRSCNRAAGAVNSNKQQRASQVTRRTVTADYGW